MPDLTLEQKTALTHLVNIAAKATNITTALAGNDAQLLEFACIGVNNSVQAAFPNPGIASYWILEMARIFELPLQLHEIPVSGIRPVNPAEAN